MGQRRRAEAPGVRQWDGDVAAANQLDEERTWVVWGMGPDPATPGRAAVPEESGDEGALDLRPGNDLARTIAAGNDPEWESAEEFDAWVVLLEADEDEVDAWVQDDERARSYAPYLLNPADPDTDMMEGTLRNDVVRRRTGGQRLDAGRPQ